MDEQDARLHAFEVLLDASKDASERKVEMSSLRRLCARGIPAEPAHLRPLAYSLLLGVVPPNKDQWLPEEKSRRERYYGMVKAQMQVIDDREGPTKPLHSADSLLVAISQDVRNTAATYRFFSQRTSPHRRSPLGPPQTIDATEDISSDSASEDDDLSHYYSTSSTTSTAKRVLNRRAIFDRLDFIEYAQNKGSGASLTEKRYTATEKGKGKANHREAMDPSNTPAIVFSDVSSKRDFVKPTLAPKMPTPPATTPRLSLSIDVESPNDRESLRTPITNLSTPITLLSPQALPSTDREESPFRPSTGYLLTPDTHAECLIRLLYVFCMSHRDIEYFQGLAQVVAVLYWVFINGGDTSMDIMSKGSKSRREAEQFGELPVKSVSQTDGWGRHAEAETFWALNGLMAQLGELLGNPRLNGPEGAKDIVWALGSLGRRVMWADQQLYDGLKRRSLDPELPQYSYQWLALLLAKDVSPGYLLPIWDFVFSEETNPKEPGNAKVDLLVDICTAMLLLVKDRLLSRPRRQHAIKDSRSPNRNLWADATLTEEMTAPVDLPLTQAELEESCIRGLEMLRAYPMRDVGVKEVLRVAWEIRQRRMIAALSGIDPDHPQWTSKRQEGVAAKALASSNTLSQRLGRMAWLAGDVVKDKVRVSAPSSAGIASYAQSLQESDAAAAAYKASSNLAASAMSGWGSLLSRSSTTASAQPATPPTRPRAETTGSDWQKPSPPPGVAKPTELGEPQRHSYPDLSQRLAAVTAVKEAPGAELYRRDSTMPPSFISPRGSIVYPAGRYQRNRAAHGDVSIQGRLSALTEQVGSQSPSGTKPLLLSGAARPASPLPGSRHHHTASTGSRSAGGLSPSSTDGESGLSRRISISRAPVGLQRRSGADSSSARLRNATNDSPSSQRRPISQASFGSESESGQRFSLQDPGQPRHLRSDSEVTTPESAADPQVRKKYSLTDGPAVSYPEPEDGADLLRKESSDSQRAAGGLAAIARRQGVKKGGRVRPAGLKLNEGANLERNDSGSTVDSTVDSPARGHAYHSSGHERLSIDRSNHDPRTPNQQSFTDDNDVFETLATTPRTSKGLPRSPRVMGPSARKPASSEATIRLVPQDRPRSLVSDGDADAESNDEMNVSTIRA